MYIFNQICFFSFIILLLLTQVSSRKHRLNLENDVRKYFSISTFGFFSEGQLEVKLNYLTFFAKSESALGFTLTKTISDSITPYMESHQNRCLLEEDLLNRDGNIQIVSFLLDLKNNEVFVNCSKLLDFLDIRSGTESNGTSIDDIEKPHENKIKNANQIIKQKRSVEKNIQEKSQQEKMEAEEKPIKEKVPTEKNKAKDAPTNEKQPSEAADAIAAQPTDAIVTTSISEKQSCNSLRIPFKSKISGERREISDFKFSIIMKGHESEGLYSLYFHNCGENDKLPPAVNLSISIVEQNRENYLSAGDIPLPKLYFLMSFIFFVTGCAWISVLRRKREETFKIHYLMGLLVFVKSLSLLFHGINYHIIANDGYPMEAWAVLYYITHLLKGALLFITIVLIGTGWAFIKHILSDKDKKIFMIVIPLQVLANVAKIIMEESEEGESQHYTWREIFILVDLVCCGAILFPVVWSIRHLQEASQTDGKAAINLEKLKLFRHFYVMIVCYIYFTRIIVYLLKITVPFQYEWLDELFRETATLLFFIVTGINFQPTTTNPYFRLSQDDDLEMDEVITQTGFTENVSKTIRSRENAGSFEESTATKRESSHEYD